MSTSVSPTSAATISSNVKTAKTGKLGKALMNPGDSIPMSAINTDLQHCAPLYYIDQSRTYALDTARVYTVKVVPMAADSSRYELGTLSEIYGDTFISRTKVLNLGSDSLHVVLNSKPPIDTYFVPQSSSYVPYLKEMLNDIDYTWHFMYTPFPGEMDTASIPGMQRPYEFTQCFINQLTTEVKENPKKMNGAEKPQMSSKATRMFIGANSKIDPSVKMFDITGKAVRNTSRVTPGLYIILNK